MDGWKTTFFLGRPVFRGELLNFRWVASQNYQLPTPLYEPKAALPRKNGANNGRCRCPQLAKPFIKTTSNVTFDDHRRFWLPGSSRYVNFLPFDRFFGWKGTNFTHLEDAGTLWLSVIYPFFPVSKKVRGTNFWTLSWLMFLLLSSFSESIYSFWATHFWGYLGSITVMWATQNTRPYFS